MNSQKFLTLNLKYGDQIYLVNDKGERFNGTYEDEYNSSNNSFKFLNFSNGQIEMIYLDNLHDLDRSQSN